MDLKETRLTSEPVLENSFLNVHRDTIRLPNGHTHERIVVRHPGASCVLALTAEEKVILVRQWRYAVDKPLLELPAGKLDHAGENPAECALRELAEETPYTAERVRLPLHRLAAERLAGLQFQDHRSRRGFFVLLEERPFRDHKVYAGSLDLFQGVHPGKRQA